MEQLQKQLQWAELRIQALEEQLRLERIAKYGPGSEKLNSTQLELLEWELGVSGDEVEAESKREPLPTAESENRRKRRTRAVKHCRPSCREWNELYPVRPSNALARHAGARRRSSDMSKASSWM